MSRIQVFIFILLSGAARGQQNLFNVPSSDITLKNKPFFQQQINFLNNGVYLFNSTFSFGPGNELEVGANALGIVLDPNHNGSMLVTNSDFANPPVYPFFTFNMQKAWKLNRSFKVALGTQTGFSVGGHFGTYDYFNLVTALTRYKLKLITGLHYASDSLFGPEDRNPILHAAYNPIGFQLGFEMELLREKLLVIGEHISGSHSLGLSTLGFGLLASGHWVLSLGYQFTNGGGTPVPNGVVLEFTYVPSATTHRRIYHEGHPQVD